MTTRHRLGPHRDPAVDTAVLDAARALLVEQGYTATSIDAIAARAGVSRPAIYRRWPSKAHLIAQAVFPDVGSAVVAPDLPVRSPRSSAEPSNCSDRPKPAPPCPD
nr:helix-turn-helix domain-containing protein [Nocardia tengchongensis]